MTGETDDFATTRFRRRPQRAMKSVVLQVCQIESAVVSAVCRLAMARETSQEEWHFPRKLLDEALSCDQVPVVAVVALRVVEVEPY